MTEAEDLFSHRGQLLETIAAASDKIKAIDARLEFLLSIEFEEDIGCTGSYEAGPLSGTRNGDKLRG
jgi:hypothetical protein